MKRSGRMLVGRCAAVIAVIPAVMFANRGGALPGHAGVPGEATCMACHVSSAPLEGQRVEITYSGGANYTPGQRGRFTVTLTDREGRNAWGFQASPRLASDTGMMAGSLVAGSGTQVVSGQASRQYITHAFAGTNSNQFEFEWDPPTAGSGNVTVYVAGNAANGNGAFTGDRIYTASLSLTPAQAGGERPAISQGGVVNVWTRKTAFAPGSWVEIYGSNFAPGEAEWSNAIQDGRLPTTLNGVSVTIDGKAAAIWYVNTAQVNALVPADVGTGNVQVVVRNAQGESTPAMIAVQDIAPVLFATGSGNQFTALLVDNQTQAIYGGAPPATRPARPGDVVQLYAVGLGPTNPALVTDRVISTPAALVNPPTVRFGQTAAEVLGAALVSPGLYQINLRVPDVTGEMPLTIEVGGRTSASDTSISVQRAAAADAPPADAPPPVDGYY